MPSINYITQGVLFTESALFDGMIISPMHVILVGPPPLIPVLPVGSSPSQTNPSPACILGHAPALQFLNPILHLHLQVHVLIAYLLHECRCAICVIMKLDGVARGYWRWDVSLGCVWERRQGSVGLALGCVHRGINWHPFTEMFTKLLI